MTSKWIGRLGPIGILMTALALASPGTSPAPAGDVPAWLREHMAAITGGTGTWRADNGSYRTEAEPFDAYLTEWRWGIGRRSMVGSLFGLQGERRVGPFWEYRLFWHPGEDRAVMQQWGADGTVGIGELHPTGAGHRSEETLHQPDGSRVHSRHESTVEGDRWATRTFLREGDAWRDNRSYVWERVAATDTR